jgi:hypothetical protein
MKIKVLPLEGAKALKAFNVFNTLMLGLKMLPLYVNVPYREFYASIPEKSDEEKENLIREAIAFVPLEQDEVESALAFCTDKNGIPYSKNNVKNMKINEIIDCVVAVCMEIGRIEITLTTESEKKKSMNSVLTSQEHTPSIQV